MGYTTSSQAEGLHVQRRGDQGWDVLDEDLARDIQETKRSALDQVTGIAEATWIDRKNFVVTDIH